MTYISLDMLRILEGHVDKGWFTVEEAEQTLGKKSLAQTLFDMYVQGLVNISGSLEDVKFETTDSARRLLEVWSSLGSPQADPWIDSRILTMLASAAEAGGYIPEKWLSILGERGFVYKDRLSLDAYEAVEAVSSSRKRIHLSKPLARTLIAVPEGPAANTYYNTPLARSLEAMNLLSYSIPLGHFASLTRPGRLLRKMLAEINLEAPAPVLLDEGIRSVLEKAVNGKRLTDQEGRLLGTIGYISSTGSLKPAARLALTAWKTLEEPYETPPFSLSEKELVLLGTIRKQWEKASNNPEEAPTVKLLKSRLEESWSGEYYTVPLTLYHLEAMGLVERDLVDGKEAIKLTEHGSRILDASGMSPSSVLAARSLIEADAARGALEDWISAAREEKLLGVGGPTRYGRALASAARTSRKSLFLTGLEALILKRIPSGRSVEKERVVDSFKKYGEDTHIALEKLETRGLVKTTPTGYLTLTTVGLRLKDAVMGVERGIAVPIHPVLIQVLKAVSEMGTDDPARLINTLRLDLDTVKTAIILARRAKYLGKGSGLTASGRALLEIVEELYRKASAERAG